MLYGMGLTQTFLLVMDISTLRFCVRVRSYLFPRS